MQQWSAFFAVTGEAAGTLLGLLFVAISVNARAILSHDHAAPMAAQAFQNYIAVIVVSLLALFPNITEVQFGIATLLLTLLWSGWVVARACVLLRRNHAGENMVRIARRYLGTIAGFALLVYAGIGMALGHDERNSTAIGAGCLLVFATFMAWDLMERLAGPAGT